MRASLLGALLVALAGLGVGVGIGGKTKVETATTTVAQTVTAAAETITTTVTAAAPETAAEGLETETTSTTPQTADAGAGEQYLADYLASLDSSELEDGETNTNLVADPSDLQLKGRTYQNAVAFRIAESGDTSAFQMPIAGFRRLTSKMIGLDTLTSAESRFRLTIYKDHADTPDATILFQASFHGPSDTAKLDIDTRGATVLVFVWTRPVDDPNVYDNFILADPIISP